eukprot:Gregarina_sp_Poly_1__2225@NODE_1595_length_3757_cov_19_105149_g1051_i0_p1_GENE_NODE_1595_length_3757_cov_19_105149_g1051_i0NODE_1595_length_3757_cov_19_105149_g1051_i0_p1_ORF_typecomplete_len976_score150_31TIP120/PF08623_10/2_3TIP120/PF08623_10/0_6TIP120/PF08623_10/2_9e03VHS/PF00790_19/0_17VHS/PF00790_19/5_5e03KAP/PF05804_12/0_82KAP/PF05804_12/8_5e03KAP/PF05804_12/5_8e03_NODE_1595_length_3757_cov_19_105149_g1051_i02313158
MNLEQVANEVISIACCGCHADSLHITKLKSYRVKFENLLSDLSSSPNAHNDCVDYMETLQAHYLKTEREDIRELCATLFCAMLRICDGQFLAKQLSTDRSLLEILTSRLSHLMMEQQEPSQSALSHQSLLLYWLSILLLIPIPISAVTIDAIEAMAIQSISRGHQLMRASNACLTAIIIRCKSGEARSSKLNKYRIQLPSSAYFSVIHGISRNFRILNKEDVENMITSLLTFLSGDDAAESIAVKEVLRSLAYLLHDVNLREEELLQIARMLLKYLADERLEVQSACATLLTSLVQNCPSARDDALSKMIALWELDPLSRFAIGLLLFSCEGLSRSQQMDEKEGRTFLRVCSVLMQDSGDQRDAQLILDLCCFFLWKLARRHPAWLTWDDSSAMFEALLRTTVMSRDRMTIRACISVIQEFVGRGLLGDGGEAMGLIPCFERDGVSLNSVVFDHVASHSKFGYQVTISAIVDSFLQSPKESLMQQNLSNLYRILSVQKLDVKSSERMKQFLLETVRDRSTECFIPVLRLLTVLLSSDETLNLDVADWNFLRTVYADTDAKCADLKIAVKQCSAIHRLEAFLNLLISLIKKNCRSPDFVAILKETFRITATHKCTKSKGIAFDFLFHCLYLEEKDMIMEIVDGDFLNVSNATKVLNPSAKVKNEALINLIFKLLIRFELDRESVLQPFDKSRWLALFQSLVSKPSVLSTTILLFEFLALVLPPREICSLCQTLLLHPQIHISQLAAQLALVPSTQPRLEMSAYHAYQRYLCRCAPIWNHLASEDECKKLLHSNYTKFVIFGTPKIVYNEASAHYDSLPGWEEVPLEDSYFYGMDPFSGCLGMTSELVTQRVTGFFNALGSTSDFRKSRQLRSFIYQSVHSDKLMRLLEQEALCILNRELGSKHIILDTTITCPKIIADERWVISGIRCFSHVLLLKRAAGTRVCDCSLETIEKIEHPLGKIKYLSRLHLAVQCIQS